MGNLKFDSVVQVVLVVNTIQINSVAVLVNMMPMVMDVYDDD